MTPDEFAEFYKAVYPRLVKGLVVVGASIEEAEDAAQEAMLSFLRSRVNPENAVAYAWVSARNSFIKKRERDRKGEQLALEGSAADAYADDVLAGWEELDDIEVVLGCLTPVQRQVIGLVMEGFSTSEIARELGKTGETIRQHRKQGRDRLKAQPQIAEIARQRDLGSRKEEVQ